MELYSSPATDLQYVESSPDSIVLYIVTALITEYLSLPTGFNLMNNSLNYLRREGYHSTLLQIEFPTMVMT